MAWEKGDAGVKHETAELFCPLSDKVPASFFLLALTTTSTPVPRAAICMHSTYMYLPTHLPTSIPPLIHTESSRPISVSVSVSVSTPDNIMPIYSTMTIVGDVRDVRCKMGT